MDSRGHPSLRLLRETAGLCVFLAGAWILGSSALS